MSGRDRNKPCPCGSGVKAKRCGANPSCAEWAPPHCRHRQPLRTIAYTRRTGSRGDALRHAVLLANIAAI
jgi:hypothetical protein